MQIKWYIAWSTSVPYLLLHYKTMAAYYHDGDKFPRELIAALFGPLSRREVRVERLDGKQLTRYVGTRDALDNIDRACLLPYKQGETTLRAAWSIHLGGFWQQQLGFKMHARRPDSFVGQGIAYREFVIDIDANDLACRGAGVGWYCACGGEKRACNSCFSVVLVTAAVFASVLESWFQGSKCLVVFSGGRGVHLWHMFCRTTAELGDTARKGLVARLLHAAPGALRHAAPLSLARAAFAGALPEAVRVPGQLTPHNVRTHWDDTWLRNDAFVQFVWDNYIGASCLDAQVSSKTDHTVRCPFSRHPRSMNAFALPLSIVAMWKVGGYDRLANCDAELFTQCKQYTQSFIDSQH